MVKQLKIWIKYLENILTYPSKFVYQFQCSTIHNFDWSGIRLPCDHYIEVMLNYIEYLLYHYIEVMLYTRI